MVLVLKALLGAVAGEGGHLWGEEVLGTGRWSLRKARLGRQTSLALQSGMSLGAHVCRGCIRCL